MNIKFTNRLHSLCAIISVCTLFIITLLFFSISSVIAEEFSIGLAQGALAGEVTETSAIVQARLTGGTAPIGADIPGRPGVGRFEISTSENFSDPIRTDWINAHADYDYVIKSKISGLRPGTRYYYRLIYGPGRDQTKTGRTCTFKTLNGRNTAAEVSLVVVTGMSYDYHYFGIDGKGKRAYTGADKALGYPGLKSILEAKPDFFVGTGDNVYFDHEQIKRARTAAEMRKKYHEQFAQPRFVDLLSQVPTYWEKDDHDYRFNDSDPYNPYKGRIQPGNEPTHELGIRIFKEQVPVTDPLDDNALTYRTHRISKDLQIWLTEGRDYRSRNDMEDGPGKSIWGAAQLGWLERTLLESDAAFKILISPTAMVGVDTRGKRDSHININGFQHEAREFFEWLSTNGFLKKNLYVVCGDRHWQYHAINPSGFEEFSCGALVDANAVEGTKSGDPRSTDPEGKINQVYLQGEISGGFLKISIKPSTQANKATADFSFYDENGELLYRNVKEAR